MKRISDEHLELDLVCMNRSTCVGCRFRDDPYPCGASQDLGFNQALRDYVQDLNVARREIARLKAKKEKR